MIVPRPVYSEINENDRETALKLIVMIEGQFDEAGDEKNTGRRHHLWSG